MDSNSLRSIRREYALKELSEANISADPTEQFAVWMNDALTAEVAEATAMTLSTVTASGQPSARVVLLKGYDQTGFVFFTNYESAKAADIASEPRVSLSIFWRELERQVSITGRAERVDRRDSEAYFASRPRTSQVGAWASLQSRPLASRRDLEERFAAVEARYHDREIPCPPNWGGYCVVPASVEFWQGRPSRLHDRIRYTRIGDRWTIGRLYP